MKYTPVLRLSVLCWFVCGVLSESAKAQRPKALFYVPTLSFSHVAFNIKLSELLASNGYDITLLVIDIDPNVKYGEVKGVKVLHTPVGLAKDRLKRSLWENPGPYEDASPLNPKIFHKFLKISQIMIDACTRESAIRLIELSDLFQNTELIQKLESENFELGFVEQYDACGLGLLQRIEVRTVLWLSATAVYRLQPEAIGINFPLSYVPGEQDLIVESLELFSTFSDRMSLLERVQNTLIAVVTEVTHKIYSIDSENRLVRRSSGTNQLRSSLLQYAANSAGVIANVSPLLDFPLPTSAAFSSVAGITVERRGSQLDEEWQRFADSATDGFVLLTFGSIAKTVEMPAGTWAALETVMGAFPDLRFIIKHEESGKGVEHWRGNAYFTKWIPQIALMSHPNYRGVITHGGWSTILETLIHRRPMVLMPLFADHFKNTRVIVEKGLASPLDKTNIQNDSIANAVAELVDPNGATKRVQKYAEMLDSASLLITPEATVLHRVHRAYQLRPSELTRFIHPKNLNLWLIERYSLDILLCAFVVVFILSK